MSLEKVTKPKMLGFKVDEEFHDKVVRFCNERNWNMSKFMRQAMEESISKVEKNESRKK